MKKEIPPQLTQRLDALNSCIAETSRLLEKMELAKQTLSATITEVKNSNAEYPYYNNNCRDFAAAKRSALDVKKELTKLTQFTVKY